MNLIRICLLISLVSIIACNRNDDDTNNPTPTNNGYFRFKSNGTQVEISKSVDVNDNKSTAALLLNIGAIAETNAFKAFGAIADFSGAATYIFENNPSSYILFTVNGTLYTLGKGLQPKSHGTFIVTDVRETSNFTYTKGTFGGVAYASDNDSIVITNGEFKDRNF